MYITYAFYSQYNMVWIANMEIGLGPNNSYKELVVYLHCRHLISRQHCFSGCLCKLFEPRHKKRVFGVFDQVRLEPVCSAKGS